MTSEEVADMPPDGGLQRASAVGWDARASVHFRHYLTVFVAGSTHVLVLDTQRNDDNRNVPDERGGCALNAVVFACIRRTTGDECRLSLVRKVVQLQRGEVIHADGDGVP
jgi:hypothetical protein